MCSTLFVLIGDTEKKNQTFLTNWIAPLKQRLYICLFYSFDTDFEAFLWSPCAGLQKYPVYTSCGC